MRWTLALKAKVTGAMVYPLIMGILGVTIVGFLFTFVIPKVTLLFKDQDKALPQKNKDDTDKQPPVPATVPGQQLHGGRGGCIAHGKTVTGQPGTSNTWPAPFNHHTLHASLLPAVVDPAQDGSVTLTCCPGDQYPGPRQTTARPAA